MSEQIEMDRHCTHETSHILVAAQLELGVHHITTSINLVRPVPFGNYRNQQIFRDHLTTKYCLGGKQPEFERCVVAVAELLLNDLNEVFC